MRSSSTPEAHLIQLALKKDLTKKGKDGVQRQLTGEIPFIWATPALLGPAWATQV